MKSLFAVALSLFAGYAFAAVPQYYIKTEVHIAGKKVSTPQLMVLEGEPAMIEVGERASVGTAVQNLTKVEVTATKSGGDSVMLNMNVEFHSGTTTFKAQP